MTKIYNEVVIDMNPESPTFEETIYEDSYEYDGDMMYAGAPPSSQPEATNYMKAVGQNSIKYEGKYYYYYAHLPRSNRSTHIKWKIVVRVHVSVVTLYVLTEQYCIEINIL